MTKSMKRIHKVTLKRIHENTAQHSDECVEINDKRARYECICETFGIRVDAEISLSRNEAPDSGYLIQHITSGGLWGIDLNNSDGGYEDEIEQEQLQELRDQLHAIGFSNRAISAAFKTVEHKQA